MRRVVLIVLVLPAVLGLAALPGQAATTITVNDEADVAANDGMCTLREAITAANTDTASGAMPGECPAGSGPDAIEFNITPNTITPGSPLPAITTSVSVDGTTDPDSSRITITGVSAGSNANGLTVTPPFGPLAENITIKGLVITGFQGTGGDAGGGHGILAIAFRPDTLAVGGIAANEGDVLSGNAAYGAFLRFEAAYTVQGNIIGLQADGTTVQSNGMGGALVQGIGSVIGGTAGVTPGGPCTGACNLISGNTGNGLHHSNQVAFPANVVQGNYIGTDVSGLLDRGNAASGILETSDSTATTIGGDAAAARNVISGNSFAGVDLGDSGASNDIILGNFIGVGADGTTPIGNGNGGIFIGGDGNRIGGIGPGQGNVIADNGGPGVVVFNSGADSAVRNSIRGNAIFANGDAADELGIDLDPPFGVSPNDPGDVDDETVAPNFGQNYPAVSSASAFGGAATVQATLNSTASATFQVDFYSSATCNDASPNDFGEGQRYLGSTTVVTDGSGNAAFTFKSSGTPAVAPGEVITATATDPNGNTSEFSKCTTVIQGSPPPPPPAAARCPGFEADSRAQIVGTSGPDQLAGTGAAEIVCGLGGNDRLKGGGGKDLILGGGGNDRMAGQGGKDVLKGQAGNDKMNGGPGVDRCQGGPGKDSAKACEKGRA